MLIYIVIDSAGALIVTYLSHCSAPLWTLPVTIGHWFSPMQVSAYMHVLG